MLTHGTKIAEFFLCVFNHFQVCLIHCRAVPRSNIYAKVRTVRFKISPKNRSQISQKQEVSYEPV